MMKIKQWSKWITLFLVITQGITWFRVFTLTLFDVSYIDSLINQTQNMFTSVMPYYALTAIERVMNWEQLRDILKKGA